MVERSIRSLEDVRELLAGRDPLVDDLAPGGSGPHWCSLRTGGGSILLVEPELWQQGLAEARKRVSTVDPLALLVCLASEDQLEILLEQLRDRRVSFLALPCSVPALRAAASDWISQVHALQQVARHNQQAERYRYELSELISIGASLNSERDISRLLGMILEKSRYVTGADAGSVYVLADSTDDPPRRVLRFEVAQNESIQVDLEAFAIEISSQSIVGAAVVKREVINIPDLYQLTPDNRWGLVHDRSFDEHTGYQTRSVLSVPMINARDDVIGVIQLINKKTSAGTPLRSAEDFERSVIPFDEPAVELCKTLAYQAAVALDNALLYDDLRKAFEGFVEASITAIEARDPTTSGHSRRVADLTVALAEAADRTTVGPYAELAFGAEQLREIEYAGLLHDFGKVGVPEQVLVKADKLYPWQLESVMARFDYIRQGIDAKMLDLQLRAARGEIDPAAADRELGQCRRERAEVDRWVEVVAKANRPTVLEVESAELLEEIAARRYATLDGRELPYLSEPELASLRVRRGSLNPRERAQIESHVVHSYNFLCMIPWGRSLKQIPAIAADHHEKLDGSGYPAGKLGEEIPVQAKMMTICDIFDALTASDRPYKKALPCERALDILSSDVASGKLDGDLFRIFTEAQLYNLVLKIK